MLYAAGSNARGQLASANLEDQHQLSACQFLSVSSSGELPSGTIRVLDLACGSNHTLLLLDRGSDPELWGCGDSSHGQLLSLGSTRVFYYLPFDPGRYGLDGYTITSIAACWETSFVILTPPTTADPQCTLAKPDVVISFGSNDFGDRGGPANATDGVTIIDFQSVCAPGIVATRVRGIATGPHHVVVLLEDKDKPISVVVGWGASRHGQLGTGNSTLATPPKSKSKRPTRPGPVQMIDKPTIIATYEDRAVNLAAGSQHTLILHQSGKITKLGSSRRGQLEIPDRIFTTPHIGCTWTASFVVSEGGQVEACGSSNHGQLGRGDNSSIEFGPVLLPGGVSQLACGSEHVLAVTGEEVWAWGWNEHGNLGVGHLEDAPVPVRVWPPVDDTIKGKAARIWAGCGTSWILAESNVVDEEKNS
ncbi:putative RCC1/BLIP-II protein [Rhizoctonia solani 123E]|uniref:Putative RCC1/BLIP-II protein n=1 Tax=Rhizoctonia solani 123E TaxID=1423351 RepID=A0A074SK22_9AGAM|nr:putative RCC1/BLIP-II protein [Rhizoctonia solani 123E]